MTTINRPLPLLGVAGHVDHGKTSLVRALTSVDTDRLPEEKARGITIELGFAVLDLATQGRVALIDVPGHERFVRTMLAGATGLDLVLLAVAADEGVMPQTREHLDICGLLGVGRGVVALTKIDRVDSDFAALAADDVRGAIRGTFLADAAVVPVSSLTGAGLAELRAAIARVASQVGVRSGAGPARLPLDRVFTLRGHGTVVTGTLASGTLRVGEAILASGSGARATVRGLQVHGVERSEACAGERVAANLGGVAVADLSRGETLVRDGEMLNSTIVDVELAVLPLVPRPIRRGAKLLFHALATQDNATVLPLQALEIAPGTRAVAQIHLGRPLPLLPGDRFVLRGFDVLPGYGTTVAGGRVLQVLAPRRRRAEPAVAAALAALAAATIEQRLAFVIDVAGATGIDRAGLRARLGEGERAIDAALARLLSRRQVRIFHRDSGAVVSAAALDRLAAAAVAAVDRFHQREPRRPGIAREALRSELMADGRVFTLLVTLLCERGLMAIDGDTIWRIGFSCAPAATAAGSNVDRVGSVLHAARLAPPWLADLPKLLALPAEDVRVALDLLLRRGEVARVRSDLYFSRPALDAIRDQLRGFFASNNEITAQAWKALCGQSRKYSIPLAEYFDAEKLTLRVGEVRRLRGG